MKRPRLSRLIIGVIVALVVLFVGGPFVYIHFIEGPAPKPLSLPTTHTGTTAHSTGSFAFPTGSWRATSASVVGYRVNEVLFGQNNVAVGRTHEVSGHVTLQGTTVSAAQFVAQMASVHSDQSQRDRQFDDRIMDVADYPTSKFILTSPIHLGHLAADTTTSTVATGNLALRGQTHPVSFTVKAKYDTGVIDITGSIPITFATWAIPNPSFGHAITTDDHGILEFLLVLSPPAAS
jgi:polyisoprenoid-binding protein YceI